MKDLIINSDFSQITSIKDLKNAINLKSKQSNYFYFIEEIESELIRIQNEMILNNYKLEAKIVKIIREYELKESEQRKKINAFNLEYQRRRQDILNKEFASMQKKINIPSLKQDSYKDKLHSSQDFQDRQYRNFFETFKEDLNIERMVSASFSEAELKEHYQIKKDLQKSQDSISYSRSLINSLKSKKPYDCLIYSFKEEIYFNGSLENVSLNILKSINKDMLNKIYSALLPMKIIKNDIVNKSLTKKIEEMLIFYGKKPAEETVNCYFKSFLDYSLYSVVLSINKYMKENKEIWGIQEIVQNACEIHDKNLKIITNLQFLLKT